MNLYEQTKILCRMAGALNLYVRHCFYKEKEPNLIRLKQDIEKIKQTILEIEAICKM